jgi:hypothetical protein
MGKIVTVWNGESVVPMDEARAKELEKRGMVQIMAHGMDATKLKPANSFTGYRTRMMRADAAVFAERQRELVTVEPARKGRKHAS